MLENCEDSPETEQVLRACNEAFTNIISNSGASFVRFSCANMDGALVVTLRDDGREFNPLAETARPEQDSDKLDQDEAGLGFVRKTAAEAKWDRDDNENVLTLKFQL